MAKSSAMPRGSTPPGNSMAKAASGAQVSVNRGKGAGMIRNGSDVKPGTAMSNKSHPPKTRIGK